MSLHPGHGMADNFISQLESGSYPVEWPGHWVGGIWQKPAKTAGSMSSLNPNDGSVLMTCHGSREILAKAIESSAQASARLSEMPLRQRLDYLKRLALIMSDWQKILVKAERLEGGKPLWEAEADFLAAHRYLTWIAENGGAVRDSLLSPATTGFFREDFQLHPVGVTLAYLPFSTPLSSFVVTLSGALLAGCPLVLYASRQSSLCGSVFAKLLEQLELPAGICHSLAGNFDDFSFSVSHPQVRAVIYTGAREHCEQILRDHRGRRRQLILQSGGKNAAIVHSTADSDLAVREIMQGAFRSAGQLCSSTGRIFVFRSVLPDFLKKLSQEVIQMSIGRTDCDDPALPSGPMMGPLYSRKSVEKFLRFQTMAHRDAEETLVWGRELENGHGGFFVSPGIHLMKEFDLSSAYQNNTLFSPDLAVYSYDVLNDAFDCLNSAGDCQSVAFFGDAKILRERSHLIRAANLMVNSPTTEEGITLPLAGAGLAGGVQRYHGPGLALYLSYPQSFRIPPSYKESPGES